MMFEGFFDLVFSPLLQLSPFVSLTVISFGLSVFWFILNQILMNKKELKNFQKRVEELRELLIKYQKSGNTEKINEIMNEFSELNKKYMSQTFKTLLISFAIVLIFIPWLKAKYSHIETIAYLPFSVPIIGNSLNWFYWYFFVSITVSFILRKIIS